MMYTKKIRNLINEHQTPLLIISIIIVMGIGKEKLLIILVFMEEGNDMVTMEI